MHACRYTNVTYTSVLSNVAGAVQVVLVSLPIGDGLRQTFSATQYEIYACLVVVSLFYTYHQAGMPKETQIHDDSRLIAYFKTGRDARRINALMLLFFVVVVAITLPLALVVTR